MAKSFGDLGVVVAVGEEGEHLAFPMRELWCLGNEPLGEPASLVLTECRRWPATRGAIVEWPAAAA